MTTTSRKRLVALSSLLILLLVLPVIALADEPLDDELVAANHAADHEVVAINRTDGRIVILDYFVGPGQVNLTKKYDEWGGPYNQVAVGDFNGDGTREIVAIGGAAVNVAGPIMHTFDPVVPPGFSAVPSIARNIGPNTWLMVRAGDIDGDGRDEIVAIRTASDPANPVISAAIECWEFTTTWVQRWSINTGGGFLDMHLADFDRDGHADIGLVRTASRVLVLDGENPQTEHFSMVVGGGIMQDWTRIRIGDVSGDGAPDLVLLRPQQAVAGNFPAAVLAIHPTSPNAYNDIFGWGFLSPPGDIELADTNSDNRLEIAAVSTGTFARIFYLNPRLANDQIPPFGNRTERETWIGDNVWVNNVVMADVNGDGRVQPILVTRTGDRLRLYGIDANEFAEDARFGPYWESFTATNLDGTGVTPGPVMSVPANITLYYDAGAAQATQATVRVRNLGTGTFTWTASQLDVGTWLQFSPTTGVSEGLINFTVNTAALPGNGGQVRVQILASEGVTARDQTITVRLVQVPELRQVFVPIVDR